MGANTTFTGANTSGQANTGANTTFMGANTRGGAPLFYIIVI